MIICYVYYILSCYLIRIANVLLRTATRLMIISNPGITLKIQPFLRLSKTLISCMQLILLDIKCNFEKHSVPLKLFATAGLVLGRFYLSILIFIYFSMQVELCLSNLSKPVKSLTAVVIPPLKSI